MPRTEIRDYDELADELLPVDGPHTDEGVKAAAALISELVRRLNHATLPGRADRSLPYPSTVDSVVGGLQGAAGKLPQLLAQLADRLDTFSRMSALYDDRYDQAPMPTGDVALTAAAYLRHEAAPRADWLADQLAQACQYTSHLGLRD